MSELERTRERHEAICKFGIGDTNRYAKFMYEDVPRLLERLSQMEEALQKKDAWLEHIQMLASRVKNRAKASEYFDAVSSIEAMARRALDSFDEAREDTK